MMEYDFCQNGFHADRCPDCDVSSQDRDDPAMSTNAAMNYGDGYQKALADLAARLPKALEMTIVPALGWLSIWRLDKQDDNPWPAFAGEIIDRLNDDAGLAAAFRAVRTDPVCPTCGGLESEHKRARLHVPVRAAPIILDLT